MFKTILAILGLLIIGAMSLILFCCCIVSSWCNKDGRKVTKNN